MALYEAAHRSLILIRPVHCVDWSLFAAVVAGTLTHMAPEVIMKGHVSKAADVYAFGIMLWEVSCVQYCTPWLHCSCAMLS